MHSTGISAFLCHGRGRRTGLVNNNQLWIKLNSSLSLKDFHLFEWVGQFHPPCPSASRRADSVRKQQERKETYCSLWTGCLQLWNVIAFFSFWSLRSFHFWFSPRKCHFRNFPTRPALDGVTRLFLFIYLFWSNILLNSMEGLKNACCFTLLMVQTRELALLRKTGQLSQPEQSMWWF